MWSTHTHLNFFSSFMHSWFSRISFYHQPLLFSHNINACFSQDHLPPEKGALVTVIEGPFKLHQTRRLTNYFILFNYIVFFFIHSNWITLSWYWIRWYSNQTNFINAKIPFKTFSCIVRCCCIVLPRNSINWTWGVAANDRTHYPEYWIYRFSFARANYI